MARAWDIPTRLFHWTLVTLILCAWLSFELAPRLGDITLVWHRWNGYAILVLICFRLLWGVVGGSTARFSAFVRWPWAALGYLRDTFSGRPRHFLGHNPAGGWMVVLLLAAVAGQGLLGLYTLEHNDLAAGPLVRTISADESLVKLLSRWHTLGFNVILALVAVHVTVNAGYQMLAMNGIINAMVTGKKPTEAFEDQHEVQGGSVGLGLICLAASVLVVFGGITLAGGRIL
jgi:cytochrome b